MSYILDALNKSEAERTRGVRPTLGMLHHPTPRSRAGLWIIAAALVVNACIGALWLTLRDRTETPSSTAVSAPPQPVAAVVPQNGPSIASRSSDAAVPPPITPTTRPARNEPIADLSNITFSTHVYSDDPAMRAVTMHGKRFVEGDMIGSGIRLAEITETGVVLEANGRRIPLEVLQDWR
jgi:general secretion pathway protein B